MPIYLYECKSCNEEVELMRKLDDATIPICKKCDNLLVKKVTSCYVQPKITPKFHS